MRLVTDHPNEFNPSNGRCTQTCSVDDINQVGRSKRDARSSADQQDLLIVVQVAAVAVGTLDKRRNSYTRFGLVEQSFGESVSCSDDQDDVAGLAVFRTLIRHIGNGEWVGFEWNR